MVQADALTVPLVLVQASPLPERCLKLGTEEGT